MLLETKKLNTLKRVLVIFRTVVSSYTECKEGGQAWDATKLVEITSLCIKTAPVVFNHHLFKRDNVPPRDIFRAAQRPAWPRLKSLVRSYLTSIFSVMKFFTDNSMKCYVVAGLTPSVPYFHFSPSKQKKLISVSSLVFSLLLTTS